jgi:hypothetical protein
MVTLSYILNRKSGGKFTLWQHDSSPILVSELQEAIDIQTDFHISGRFHAKSLYIHVQRRWKITLTNEEFYRLGYNAVRPLKINRGFEGTCRFQFLPSSLLAGWFTLVSCLAYSPTLKMEGTFYSENSCGFRRTARYYVPEDRSFHNHRLENFASVW